MKKNDITKAYIVMLLITIICVVTVISSVSYYQFEDLQNRITISDLTNNLTELREASDKSDTMKAWYTQAYNSCIKRLETEVARCPAVHVVHPTGEYLTMNESIRIEHYQPAGEMNSTVIYYNPNKVNFIESDSRYYALFTSNLSECDLWN